MAWVRLRELLPFPRAQVKYEAFFEPLSQAQLGTGDESKRRSQVAGTVLKLKGLPQVHSHCFFQVCGFHLQ